MHNVAWTCELMDRMRAAIAAGTFDALRAVSHVWMCRPVDGCAVGSCRQLGSPADHDCATLAMFIAQDI